jgi:hypothetical protein
LHLVIIFALFAHYGTALFAPPLVAAQRSGAGPTERIPFDFHLRALDQALGDLAAAQDVPARATALAAVEAHWQLLRTADIQLQQIFFDQQALLQNAALPRITEAATAHEQRMQQVRARYTALRSALTADKDDLRVAVDELRRSIALEATARAGLPAFEQLPHRPADAAGPLEVLSLTSAQLQVRAVRGELKTTPTSADLEPSEDVQITPEIVALAAELNNDPVAIFAYVRNSITYDPYYGSRKGALLTLWERSGNDADIASLLIALLRASDIPARYVRGTVLFDGAAARNWVGNAATAEVAGGILATGGTAVALTADGDIVKDHIWVEAFVSVPALSEQLFLPLISTGGTRAQTNVAMRPVEPQQQSAASWIALDASFKQYTYHEGTDFSAITGFDLNTVLDEAGEAAASDQNLQALVSLPVRPAAQPDGDPTAEVALADVVAADAYSKTLSYINARPNLTNVDLLGGATINKVNLSSLRGQTAFTIIASEPIERLSVLPTNLRDSVTIAVLNRFGSPILSYTASAPSLANKRITVSYEAATAADQATIDANGGTLLTTPPIIDLVPVLRLNGVEVARGEAAQMGTAQTRSITFSYATGQSTSVQNSVAVGETFALGLAYGRTSAEALTASQQRLAAARAALVKDENGDPDVNAPQNMSEPVVGEMLNQAMLGYFSQLDAFNELVARERDVRAFRVLSGGIATQNLVFGYSFGVPVETRGGGMSYDIQQNVLAVLSLNDTQADERAFFLTAGYYSSALEHSLFENLGQGSVSSIRLLALALQRGIPIYRITSENSAIVLPRLQLDASTESYIASAVAQGQVVTAPERALTIEDWSGVGFIVANPQNGAAAYLISGGLFGELRTTNGGSFWDILQTVQAYAWLAINMGLDVWGIIAGLGLLLAPDPTLLTKVAGIALIIANLAALVGDVSDLMNLASGEKSAEEFLGEQLTGLILEAILKRVGIGAASEVLKRLGPDALDPLMRQLNKLTDGLADRFARTPCVAVGLAAGPCAFLSEAEFIDLARRLPDQNSLQQLDRLAQRYGNDVAERLIKNSNFSDSTLERIVRAVDNAPNAPGVEHILERASKSNNAGDIYELVRARANVDSGKTLAKYGDKTPVSYNEVTGFDANGDPIFSPNKVTRDLEGDSTYTDGTWTDAKDKTRLRATDTELWNQIIKAKEAVADPNSPVQSFRFEAQGPVDQKLLDWVAANAPGVEIIGNLGGSLK